MRALKLTVSAHEARPVRRIGGHLYNERTPGPDGPGVLAESEIQPIRLNSYSALQLMKRATALLASAPLVASNLAAAEPRACLISP